MTTPFSFISFAQFFRDIREFASQLPAYDAVVGVPRSGLLPSSYIAMLQNIRSPPLEQFLASPREAVANAYLRSNNPKHQRKMLGRVLIIDDSCSSMRRTMGQIAWILSPPETHALRIDYAAIYGEPAEESAYEVPRLTYHKEVVRPRMFEWNFYRHSDIRTAMLDMDGVICEDWLGSEGDDPEAYQLHIQKARPKYIPERKVRAIVTNRLEKYRKETEAWLAHYGVEYEELIMCSAETPEERRAGPARWELKAEAMSKDPDALLFVESESKTARGIAELLPRRRIICLDTGEFFGP